MLIDYVNYCSSIYGEMEVLIERKSLGFMQEQ